MSDETVDKLSKSSSLELRVNKVLIAEAIQLCNGANVHRMRGLIGTYQGYYSLLLSKGLTEDKKLLHIENLNKAEQRLQAYVVNQRIAKFEPILEIQF